MKNTRIIVIIKNNLTNKIMNSMESFVLLIQSEADIIDLNVNEFRGPETIYYS